MKIRLIYLSLLLTFFSCEKDIEVKDMPINAKLVLNAVLNPDSAFRLEFSTSGDIQGNLFPKSQKDVQFFLEEDGQYLGQLRLDSSLGFSYMDGFYAGLYASPLQFYYFTHDSLRPRTGRTYHILAQSPQLPEIRAYTLIPAPPLVEDIELIRYFTLNADRVNMARLRFSLNDSAAQAYGYSVRLRYYNEVDSTWHYLGFVTPDPVLIENKPSDIIDTGGGTALGFPISESESAIFSSQSFKGQKRQFELYAPSSLFKDSLGARLDVRSLSREQFEWQRSYELQLVNQSDPFAAPVQIKGNVENGLGVFAGSVLRTFLLYP